MQGIQIRFLKHSFT